MHAMIMEILLLKQFGNLGKRFTRRGRIFESTVELQLSDRILKLVTSILKFRINSDDS